MLLGIGVQHKAQVALSVMLEKTVAIRLYHHQIVGQGLIVMLGMQLVPVVLQVSRFKI